MVADLTAANDNAPRSATDNRPAAFDAAIAAYIPGLRKLACRYTKTQEQRDDLVSETVIYALDKWRNFRPHDDSTAGMWTWLSWQMRGIVKNASVKAAYRRKTAKFVPMEEVKTMPSTPAAQESIADLSAVLGQMAGVKNGDVLVRRAMGDRLEDIAQERGLSRERIRQLEVGARRQLKEMAA